MESFLKPPIIWFVLGFVLFLLEFVIPGLILFFFAVGAWIVAIITLFLDISINTQLLIFLGTSIITILLLRNWVKKIIIDKNDSKEIMEDEFLGKTGIALTPISPGRNGKVDFKGTTWDGKSDDVIDAGENVIIIGNDSILLIVKSTKTLA
jgi:inner membrane protein